ncbi:MAG: class I SAM-dependent methyltransferase [Actinobacteria bacterium]|nr:class I SAM-dependent methyltransferase [Actinomycetota bacterium]
MDIESFANEWYREDPQIAGAREHASHLAGSQISPATGGLLRTLAGTLNARAAVQAGGDGGVSSLYLLSGMADDGVLTAIEADPAADNVAREVFREVGTGHRVRPITGRSLDVISRLADHAYDLVVIGSGASEPTEHLQQAMRLLRPGGVVVFLDVLGDGGAVLDPSRRDEKTSAARHFLTDAADNPGFTASLIPIDGGVLIITAD